MAINTAVKKLKSDLDIRSASIPPPVKPMSKEDQRYHQIPKNDSSTNISKLAKDVSPYGRIPKDSGQAQIPPKSASPSPEQQHSPYGRIPKDQPSSSQNYNAIPKNIGQTPTQTVPQSSSSTNVNFAFKQTALLHQQAPRAGSPVGQAQVSKPAPAASKSQMTESQLVQNGQTIEDLLDEMIREGSQV